MSGQSPALSSVAFFLAATVALGASFVLVVRLERLADRWHLSEAMLGLVVALAADAPEISSAVSASIRGDKAIGAGVVLGSNVFNLAALLGLSAIVAGRIALHRRVLVFEGVIASWVAAVSVIVVVTRVGAGVGLALVLVVVGPYVVLGAVSPGRLRSLRLSERLTEWIGRAVAEEEAELAEAIHPRARGSFDTAIAGASVVVVVVASTVMERSATSLGHHFGLSNLIIGGIVLAAVTSLPNAVGAVYLAARGRGAALVSEATNSNMLNVVVGMLLPALFLGLASTSRGSTLVVWFYLGLTVLSFALALAGRGLSRWAGLVIVTGYLAFLAAAVRT